MVVRDDGNDDLINQLINAFAPRQGINRLIDFYRETKAKFWENFLWFHDRNVQFLGISGIFVWYDDRKFPRFGNLG